MVKSVQRGIATISTAVTNVDVTISAVVTANSVIRCWVRGNQISYWRDKFPVSSITNTTTINLSINATPYSNTPVIWEVVEYYDGVIKTKQTGTLAAGTLTLVAGYVLTVTSVTTSKAMLIFERTATEISNDHGAPTELACSADLESATQIRFRSGYPGDYTFNGVFKWQLVEFY
jgi:hypothetical protein